MKISGIARATLTACALFVSAAAAQETDVAPPETRREDVVDTFHGAAVHDPYRWLEAVDSPDVMQWVRAQNDAAEAFAGPGVATRAARMREWLTQRTVRQYTRAGDQSFFLQGWSGSPDQGLFVGDPDDGSARWLDGAHLTDTATTDRSVLLHWPSPDGRYVLSLSSALGDTWGELRLIDVASGDIVARHANAHTSITTASWLPDGSGYLFAAYERDGDAPVGGHIMMTPLRGTPREVFAAIPDGENRHRLLTVSSGQTRGRFFVEATIGTSGVSDLFAVDIATQRATQLTQGGGQWSFLGARGDSVWAYTSAEAPNGRIVRIDRLSSQPRLRTVIAEGEGNISAGSQVGGNATGMFGDRIALLYQENAQSFVRVFDLNGRQRAEHATPTAGAIWGGFSPDGDRARLFYQFLGGAEPGSIYGLDLHSGAADLITAAPGGIAREDLVAERIFVDSVGDARVPVIISHRAGLDMTRPHRVYLYAYGAFGWVSFLYYQPNAVDWWSEDDGILAIAGVRGGGEFGADWHEAGRKLQRQNAIEDYLAVAEHLIGEGYTTRELLVANGGSISGGLIGAAANARPDLFGAVVLDYAALDLIRYPLAGHARYWVDELGSPDNADEFAVLRAISPYHNVPQDRCPPATLVRIGPNDHTVTPMHGYKYAAAVQARAAACHRPAFLDVMEGAGHNFGVTPEEIARNHAVALEFLDRVLPEAP